MMDSRFLGWSLKRDRNQSVPVENTPGGFHGGSNTLSPQRRQLYFYLFFVPYNSQLHRC